VKLCRFPFDQPVNPRLIHADRSLIFVPGIGTGLSAGAWGQSSIIKSLYQISGHLTSKSTYFAFWNHELPVSKILSWPDLHASANALLIQINAKLAELPFRYCPIIFIGHSVGGILIKEVI
jgi:hypothetical protein